MSTGKVKRYNLTGHVCRKGHECNDMAEYEDGEWIKFAEIDAALRRAKAEGVRELVGHEQLAIQILDALERGGYLVSGPDGEEIGLTILDEADKFLDARAAQIEQGE